MSTSEQFHYRYNFFYISIILTTAIIVLITIEWGAIPSLEKLITFGLTLTSLFLAFIAIIFAIFSNFSFSRSTANLQNASSKISETSEKLTEATSGIEKQISHIPGLIETFGTSVQDGQKELLGKFSKKEAAQPTIHPSDEIADNVDNFREKTSYTGRLALYVCKLAKHSNKAFQIEDIPIINDQPSYVFGYLIACKAMGLVEFTNNNDMLVMLGINSTINDNIENDIQEAIEHLCNEENSTFDRDKLNEELIEISTYFNS